jgi:hypothetical protein
MFGTSHTKHAWLVLCPKKQKKLLLHIPFSVCQNDIILNLDIVTAALNYGMFRTEAIKPPPYCTHIFMPQCFTPGFFLAWYLFNKMLSGLYGRMGFFGQEMN